MYQYKAYITNVVDGDTVDMEVDLGFSIKFTERFRILDLDTPETRLYKGKVNEAQVLHGKEAKEKAIELLLNQMVTIDTKLDKKGKYGRYLCEITLPSGQDYACVMIDLGYQKKEEY